MDGRRDSEGGEARGPEKRQEKEGKERNNLKNSGKKERKGEPGKEGGVTVRHTQKSRNIQRIQEEDTGGWSRGWGGQAGIGSALSGGAFHPCRLLRWAHCPLRLLMHFAHSGETWLTFILKSHSFQKKLSFSHESLNVQCVYQGTTYTLCTVLSQTQSTVTIAQNGRPVGAPAGFTEGEP